MAESAWKGYEEPLFVPGPGEGLIYFGAQVGWDKSREGQLERDCTECGGLLIFMLSDVTLPIPIPFSRAKDFDPEIHGLAVPEDDAIGRGLCAGCMRWARDHHLMRLMDREFAQRGTNQPIPVAVPEGSTLPIAIAHIQV